MAHSKWKNFQTVRREDRKDAGIFGILLLVILAFAVSGAIGAGAYIFMVIDALAEYHSEELTGPEAPFNKGLAVIIFLISGAIGAVGVGKWLWKDRQYQRSRET